MIFPPPVIELKNEKSCLGVDVTEIPTIIIGFFLSIL